MRATIVTPPASRRLTTVTRAREMLGFDLLHDRAVAMAIAQASGAAEDFCKRIFGRATYRERFGPCRDEDGPLLLDASPVAGVVSVHVDGALLPANEYEAVGIKLGRLNSTRCVPWRGRQITVQYTAGWILPDDNEGAPPPADQLPAPIERAVILLVNAALSVRRRDPLVKQESTEGVGSVSYWVPGSSSSLPDPEAESLLKPYRRVPFA